MYMAFMQCGEPFATPAEVAEWNTLQTGASAIGDISVGLLGYDISCLEHWCQLIDYKDDAKNKNGVSFSGYCAVLESR